MNSPADAIAGFQEDDGFAGKREALRRRQSGGAGAEDGDVEGVTIGGLTH